MSKMNLQDLKDLFSVAKVNGNKKISKHQASKKGYKHVNHRASKGEFNHAVYIMNGGKK